MFYLVDKAFCTLGDRSSSGNDQAGNWRLRSRESAGVKFDGCGAG